MCFVAKVARIQTSNQGLLVLGFFNTDDDQDWYLSVRESDKQQFQSSQKTNQFAGTGPSDSSCAAEWSKAVAELGQQLGKLWWESSVCCLGTQGGGGCKLSRRLLHQSYMSSVLQRSCDGINFFLAFHIATSLKFLWRTKKHLSLRALTFVLNKNQNSWIAMKKTT